MKRLMCFMVLCATIISLHAKRIAVITASYNNKDYYQWSLDSLLNQTHDDWYCVYTDDCSPDGTGDLVEDYIEQKGCADKFILTQNTQRRGAMANQYTMIHSCDPEDVVVILDGDDALNDPDVLRFVSDVYEKEDVWLTYGQFQEWPSGARGFCHEMPQWVIERNAFRRYQDIPSHLRTFYAGLFQKIKKQHLMKDGEFLVMCADIAAMFPMIEMASNGHFKFIPNILLKYNAFNPINDHKVSKRIQRELDLYIRSLPVYAPLDSLF